MVLGSLNAQIDQVAGMGNDRTQLPSQGMMRKGLGLRFGKGLGEPLHVVLHKNLHRGATNPYSSVDRSGNAADRWDMGTQ